jgi:hypothetical protein
VPESNFKLLLEAMDAGPVVAAYFPDALRAWSILADREQMATLPKDLKFVLPDAIIHSHAIIGYPDVMARGYSVPGINCAANTYWLPEHSLAFGMEGNCLGLDDAGLLSGAGRCSSSGLMLLG